MTTDATFERASTTDFRGLYLTLHDAAVRYGRAANAAETGDKPPEDLDAAIVVAVTARSELLAEVLEVSMTVPDYWGDDLRLKVLAERYRDLLGKQTVSRAKNGISIAGLPSTIESAIRRIEHQVATHVLNRWSEGLTAWEPPSKPIPATAGA